MNETKKKQNHLPNQMVIQEKSIIPEIDHSTQLTLFFVVVVVVLIKPMIYTQRERESGHWPYNQVIQLSIILFVQILFYNHRLSRQNRQLWIYGQTKQSEPVGMKNSFLFKR